MRGEECIDFGNPQSFRIVCAESVYLRLHRNGPIISIAHQGKPATKGGTYRLAYGAVVKDRRVVLFTGNLTPECNAQVNLGLFMYRHDYGTTMPVATPGDSMPGGGNLVVGGGELDNIGFNEKGEAVFFAVLDTDENHDGVQDTGVYVWREGALELVVRTGTHIPGIGTVTGIDYNAKKNNHGQVLTAVFLAGGGEALLLATPQFDRDE